ncbi:DUF4097 family beta strand repeat-containing protein [Paenibacillus mendelii]|uniref:DUF4097 family beta strand repeat-containing protein n=1 Tax=Paenibacillus mendelii TaxID=206163 RepID=A0ABV6JBN6_9BACL|nr:DUF4097 family beta strand repeat-containing protein [Paenibacillus mendelii]MCQ6562577.1 DUF4097 family beta strand repeat-containing protein [Paenibacillus mendelii]
MRENKRATRIWARLLSFLVPGAGHLVLGLHMKGLLLVAVTLTDLVAMIRFADEGGGEFALLIVYLGLALPFFWFYSVFDTLQEAARLRGVQDSRLAGDQPKAAVIALQGALIISLGLVLLVLVRAPTVLTPWLDTAGVYAPGIGLAAVAIFIGIQRGSTMFKMGRLTAAVIIMTVGGLLLWDQIKGRNDINLLGQWWPAAFVLLGLEVVIFGLVYRTSSKRLSFDLVGSLLAVVIAVTAYGVTQYSAMPFRWLDEWKVNLAGMAGYGEEKGFRYDKELIKVPVEQELAAIAIDNPNGKVTLKKGDVSEIEIVTVLWVDSGDQQEADDVAANSMVEVDSGKKLTIKAKGESYGTNGNRKPRMNMMITVPADSHLVQLPADESQQTEGINGETLGDAGSSESIDNGAPANTANTGSSGAIDADGVLLDDGQSASNTQGTDMTQPPASSGEGNADNESPMDHEERSVVLTIQVTNGSVDVSGLNVPGGLQVKVTNGEIAIREIRGSVGVETKNGSITVADIDGNARLETYNGIVKAARIQGDLAGSTLSGGIEVEQLAGAAEVETKNGEILIREASSSIKADTLNGNIEISSSVVGGDWDIDSSIGEIRLFIPENGSYTVNGSVTFGNVATDLPLTASKKTIRGDIGSGDYRINIDANSSISVNRYNN